MNRAERRRKEREISKKINISREELNKIKAEATNTAIDKMLALLFTIPMMALKEEGYGQKRLQRVQDRMTEILKDVEEGKRDLNQIMEYMKNNYGIVFGKENKWN